MAVFSYSVTMTDIRKIVLTTILIIGAAACGQGDKVPDNVLSKEKMSAILLDMNLADAYSYDIAPIRGMPVPDSVRQDRIKLYYRQILDLHHISVKDFMSSYHYYEAHANRLKEVYDMMQAEVARQKSLAEGEERRQRFAEDPGTFFPYPKNTVISKKQDTIFPFLKRKH